MSAISLKSITGITSITTPAGADNQLTLHTYNTTERLKIDEAGNIHVNNNLSVSGITTLAHTGANQLVIKDSDTSGDNARMRISFQDSGGTEKFFVGNNNTNGWLYLGSPSGQNNNIAFRVNGNDKFQVNGNGAYVNDDLTVNGTVDILDSIIHTGDTNTKIRFPAADTFSVETAGSTRLKAENSGVVITGVTTFSASAHVSNANGSLFFGAGSATAYGSQGGIGRASNAGFHISGSAVGDFCIAAEGSKNILFGTKTGTGIGGITKRMYIASDGHVVPGADSSYDLGLTGTRWRNVYADTLYGDGSNLTGISQVGGASTVSFNDNVPIYFGDNNDYKVYFNNSKMFFEPTHSGTQQFEMVSNNQMYIKSKASGLFLVSGNQNVIDIYGGSGGGVYFKWNNSQKLKLENGNWTYLNGATVTHAGDVSIPDSIIHVGDTNTKIRFPADDTFTVETAGSERLRITSTGTVLKGLTTARQNYSNNTSGVEYGFQIEATSATKSSLSLIRSSNDANDGGIFIGKTRSTSVGGNTVVQAGDDLGTITFGGADGTTLLFGAEILAEVQSGVGNDDMPTDIIFKTNGGSTSTVERLRITSTGLLLGGTDASNNTTLGGNAGDSITTGGISNTLIGKDAGTAITSGDSNTAVGYLALKTMAGQAGCVAVGSNALEVCTGADNLGIGFAAGQQVAGGTNNCLFGSSAGLMIQEGDHNVAIGRDALRMGSNGAVNNNVVAGSYSLNQLTNAYNNVVIGYNCSGSGTMTGGTSWHSNVVIGYQAGNIVPSTASNIIIGKYTCGNAGSSQSDNIVMGTNAGKYLGNSSNNCVILGQEAAQNAGYGSGSNHAYAWTHSIAIGYRAFYNATGAPDAVVAIGSNCLKEHKGDGDGSSGGYIVAMGQQAFSTCEHMRHSVAIGNDAGAYWNPVKGNQHEGGGVFVGGGAGRYGGTAPSLIAIGRDAGNASSANPMSGPHNLLIGSRSGEKIRDGENNTCIGGNYCALFLQTGDWNTILGSLAGYAYDTTNAIQSGSYCTQIGAYTRSSGASNNYENCFGYGVVGKGANTTHIRGSAYNSNNSSSWSTTSDERIKKNIVDNNIGLDAIEKIRVRNFEYRTQNEITDFDDPKSVVVEKEGVQLGVIAQEIKDILPDVVKQNTTGAYAVDPDNLTWYLVNAVKELSAEVKSLKAQLNS